jgi:hypothetical protein
VHGRLLGVSFRGSQVKVTLGYGADARLVFELPGSIAAACRSQASLCSLL